MNSDRTAHNPSIFSSNSGNAGAAQKDLRKRGKALASKKSGRAATEGLLALAQTEGRAALIELNCETDFVARNEIFQLLALSLAKQALLVENTAQTDSGIYPVGPECLEDLKFNLNHPKLSGETTVQNAITEVAAIMGEKQLFRMQLLNRSNCFTGNRSDNPAFLYRPPPSLKQPSSRSPSSSQTPEIVHAWSDVVGTDVKPPLCRII